MEFVCSFAAAIKSSKKHFLKVYEQRISTAKATLDELNSIT